MSESQFNYTVIEKMHKSPIWDNHILKVRVRGKDKIYILKLYGGINEPFQKLVFNREMEALKVLNSCSNIVKIRDTTASLKYNGKSNYGAILMDYVDGKTLDLYDWHLFTQLKKYEICLKILQAVYNAHANDVIHRDLKPQNIIYDDVNDEITIIDFGSSKIKTIIEKETTMPMFSENYSAPEVVKGNDITEKCDYYSLGVIFSELFLCKEAESNVETICLIEKSSMDEVLKDMLCSMLQDNPSDRPESIDEITDVFTQLIGELNTSANDYSVFIDFEKMRYLKRSMVIENSMNMTQFTNSFLKREFSERYGYYDEHHGKYIIRKLMDGEYRDILKYIVSQSSDVDLYVDNLDDWAFDSQFTAALTENMGKSNLSIYYAQSNNIKAAKKQIEWNFKGGCKYVEKDKKCFFCWKTESYLLYGVPKLRNVIDDNTTCLCMSYYLRINA